LSLDLRKAKPLPPQEREQRVLALTGGGVRGIFTASVLDNIEKKTARKVDELFSVLAGTSIGGIVAIGLAVGVRPEKIRDSIRENAPVIFHKPVRDRILNPLNVFKAAYRQEPLRAAIKSILGEKADMTLQNLNVPLVITAVEYNRAVEKIFVSKPLAASGEDLSVRLIDVALATSAAPTYFPPHRIGDRVYVDGGLIANAPDLVAAQRCVERLGVNVNDLYVMSVGTASGALRGRPRITSPGRAGWLLRHRIFDITIEAQAALSISQLSTFLGDRFHRIDKTPDERIDLDEIRCLHLAELQSLGEEAVEEFCQKNATDWNRFFSPSK